MKKFLALLIAIFFSAHSLAYCGVVPGNWLPGRLSIQATDNIQSFVIEDFRLGLNTRTTPTELQPGEVSAVSNMDIDELGAIKTRLGSSRLSSTQVGNLLHDFDATTNWSASTDGAGLAKSTATYKEYDGSLEFDKTGTSEATVYIVNTSLSLNLSTYDTSKFQVLFHLPVTTNVSSVFIRFGSGASDWKEYVSTQSLSAGWNLFTVTASSATSSSGTINWAAITTIRVGANFAAAANTFTDLKVDCLLGIPETAMPITGLHYYVKEAGTKYLLCSAGVNVYSYDSGTGIFIPIITSLTSGLPVEFLTFKDLAFFVNGTDEAKKFNGTVVTKMGITTPASVPTVADAGSGAGPNGTYTYKVTYVSATHESNASAASGSVVVADNDIALTAIPTSADTQVTSRKLYRIKNGGSTYFFVATIADNTTTTYNDTFADTELGTAEAPDFQSPPPAFKYLVSHKNYLFGSGHSTASRSHVWVSKLDTPEGWDESEGFFKVQTADGDFVTGLGVFLDSVLIFKQRSLYIAEADIYSGDNEDVDLRKINTNEGTSSHRSITIANNMLFYLNPNGVFAFNGASVNQLQILDNISTENIAYKIQPTIEGLNQSLLDDAAGVYYKDKYWLSVADGAAAANDTVLPYFTKIGAWSKYDGLNITCFEFYEPSNTLFLYGGTSDGYVIQLETGTSDAGTAITYSFTTPWFDFGFPNLWKEGQYYYSMAKGNSDFDITIRHFFDYGEGTAQSVDVDPGGTAWGAFTWGNANWGGERERVQVRKAASGRFNFVKFKVEHSTLSETITFYGIEFLYSPKNYRDYTIS